MFGRRETESRASPPQFDVLSVVRARRDSVKQLLAEKHWPTDGAVGPGNGPEAKAGGDAGDILVCRCRPRAHSPLVCV